MRSEWKVQYQSPVTDRACTALISFQLSDVDMTLWRHLQFKVLIKLEKNLLKRYLHEKLQHGFELKLQDE